jgi:TonB family protein
MFLMEIKRTLALSVIMHGCLFTAVLLLSANIQGGSVNNFDDKVFFVKLSKEFSEIKKARVVEKNILLPVQPLSKPIVTEKPPEMRKEITREIHTEEEKTGIPTGISGSRPEVTSQQKFKEPAAWEGTDTDAGDGAAQAESIEIISTQDSAPDESGLFTLLSVDGGASLSGSDEGDGVVPKDIIDAIRNAIERNKVYPLAAQKRGTEGTVRVSFSITPKGNPARLRIVKSSGSRILDRATLEIVKKAAPFPSIDASLEIPVVFRLD